MQPLTPAPGSDAAPAGAPAARRRRATGCLGQWAGRLALLAASSCLALLLAEGVVRLAAPQQLILLRPDIWKPHDGLGWVQAPNLDTRINTGEREVRLLTDGEGHRVGPRPTAPPTRRVLALGDSFLAALQVEYEHTLTALVEERLSAGLGEPVRVVNTGVGGWGPSHYLLKARRELARRSYDQAVVFFYLGNDAESRKVDHFRPKKATIRHSFRWPRQATRAEIVASILYPVNDFLETRSHLYVLLKNRAWLLLMRLGLSARRFPSELLREHAEADRWQIAADLCRSISEAGAEHGVPVLFVLLPGVREVDPEIVAGYARGFGIEPAQLDPDQPSRRMSEELAERGLRVIDATPALRAAHAAGVEDLYGEVDSHLGRGGHAVMADAVVPHLLESLRPAVDEAGRQPAPAPARGPDA